MIQRAPVGDIRRPSNSCNGGPETSAFIQCVNGKDPQIHKLWCWDIDGIFCEVHPTAHVDIPSIPVGEFFTYYLSESGRHNHIIGEMSINGSVQLIALSQIWGSGFLFIVNLQSHVEATGWGISSNGNPGSGTPGSSSVTGIWSGRFAHSTVNWIRNWDGSVNTSSDDFLQSPISPRVYRHWVHNYFLYRRHHHNF